MIKLIKKGGLRERANRSRAYQGSENTQARLEPNRYQERSTTQTRSTPTTATTQPTPLK